MCNQDSLNLPAVDSLSLLHKSALATLFKAHLLSPHNKPRRTADGVVIHPLGMADFTAYAALRGKPWHTGVDRSKDIDIDELFKKSRRILLHVAMTDAASRINLDMNSIACREKFTSAMKMGSYRGHLMMISRMDRKYVDSLMERVAKHYNIDDLLQRAFSS